MWTRGVNPTPGLTYLPARPSTPTQSQKGPRLWEISRVTVAQRSSVGYNGGVTPTGVSASACPTGLSHLVERTDDVGHEPGPVVRGTLETQREERLASVVDGDLVAVGLQWLVVGGLGWGGGLHVPGLACAWKTNTVRPLFASKYHGAAGSAPATNSRTRTGGHSDARHERDKPMGRGSDAFHRTWTRRTTTRR